MDWGETTVLITGGTGSFGQKAVEILLRDYQPKRLCVLSRDELKQSEMQRRYPHGAPGSVRYFLGDVRDRERLRRAFAGVDVVAHAAALKQVVACEYNVREAIATNVMGTQNVVEAAIDAGVKKVMFISSDKACQPINLYGKTKAVAESLVVQSNAYSGAHGTRFAVVRYGNVAGSRGSVIPLFLEQRKTGKITITHEAMTRFWLTLNQGVQFVLKCIETMNGGEIFVPKLPSVSVLDIAAVIAPDCRIESIGIRPGEKIHECLISEDEARTTVEYDDYYVIQPTHPWWQVQSGGKPVPKGCRYASDTNDRQLSEAEIRGMVLEHERQAVAV